VSLQKSEKQSYVRRSKPSKLLEIYGTKIITTLSGTNAYCLSNTAFRFGIKGWFMELKTKTFKFNLLPCSKAEHS
jgi:hypothetical protein